MTTRYLPSLDGWRAVAILSVILYHSTLLKAGFFNTSWFWRYGNRGVDVFFAISGLLITTKLLEEEKATATISLRAFYMRRAFRILPPALLFLFTIALLGSAGKIPVSGGEIFSALFFSIECSILPGLPTTFGRFRLKNTFICYYRLFCFSPGERRALPL
jgi:peptidoglycan/LPS O-acetylase OafA/YrhL